MRNFSLKEQIYGFIITLLVGIMIIALAVIWPAARNMIKLRTEIKKTHQYLEDRYENAHKVRSSLTALAEIEDNILLYEQTALKKGEELSLITELEKIAEKNNIQQKMAVELIDPKKNDKSSIKKVHYKFSFIIIGNYENIRSYLKDLEILPQYLKIEKIIWEMKEQSGVRGTLTARFDAIVYAK